MKTMKAPRVSIAVVTVGHSGEEGVLFLRVMNPKPFPHPTPTHWEHEAANEAALNAHYDELFGIIQAALKEKGYDSVRPK